MEYAEIYAHLDLPLSNICAFLRKYFLEKSPTFLYLSYISAGPGACIGFARGVRNDLDKPLS